MTATTALSLGPKPLKLNSKHHVRILRQCQSSGGCGSQYVLADGSKVSGFSMAFFAALHSSFAGKHASRTTASRCCSSFPSGWAVRREQLALCHPYEGVRCLCWLIVVVTSDTAGIADVHRRALTALAAAPSRVNGR